MKILVIFSALLMLGCAVTPVVDFEGYKYSRATEVGLIYWSPLRVNTGYTKAYGTSKLYIHLNNGKDTSLIWFSANFINIVDLGTDNSQLCSDKNKRLNSDINYFSIHFSKEIPYPKEYDGISYKFDSSKSYMLKNNEKIQLQEISIASPKDEGSFFKNTWILRGKGVVEYSNYEIKDSETIYYKSPFVCEDLDGVEVEIGGLYVNGVEAPPLRFKMNYKDFIKKRWPK